MFVDIATINVVSGKGGAGCVSTRREKFVPKGGPDGGNGGDGGSVWVVAESESSTLLDFRFRRNYTADSGQPGSGRCRSGSKGEDLEIPVPSGTAIYDEDSGILLGDLLEVGSRVLVVQGGRGGRGNYMFRSARNQTPMHAQPGEPGQRRRIRLELKLIADIGLIGAPNAGKSTLLSVLTSARPKVADYPFTTLEPNLGIADLGDFVSCTLADIPGLIAGASDGKGLGLEFLRHVERTRALLYLVDITVPDPVAELVVLRQELHQYGHRLPDLEFAVVLTKVDLVDAAEVERARQAVQAWSETNSARDTLTISAVSHAGLDALRHCLRSMYRDTKETAPPEPPPET